MRRASADRSATPSAQRRRRRWPGRLLRWAVGIAAAVVAFNALSGRRDELAAAFTILRHLRWTWVLVAVAAEVASIGAYAALQQRLLLAGGLDVGLGPLTGVTLAANAIQNSLPVGPAWSTVYAFRQFRRCGADPVLAGWTLLVSSVIAFTALGAIALVGLAVSQEQASDLDLVWTVMGVMVVGAVLVAAVRRGLVAQPARSAAIRVVRASQRFLRRPSAQAEVLVEQGWERLRAVQLSRRALASAAGWALTNWMLDLTCLAVSFAAVRSPVPWRGLLLAYGAGQLAANLPITLGGLGVVEGSLTVALVFYGGAEAATVAAVLLYRIVSFWLMLPLGWGSALWLRLRPPGRLPAEGAVGP